MLSIFIPPTNAKEPFMDNLDASIEVELRHHALFSLTDAAEVRIHCHQGVVWITLDNDPRDIVLEAGGSFSTPKHRRALIYALESSRLSVTGAAPATGLHLSRPCHLPDSRNVATEMFSGFQTMPLAKAAQ
jgi:hypothetical protein